MAEETPAPSPESPEPLADYSIAEHEAAFGPESPKRPSEDPEPEPDDDVRRPPRERDDQGKFVKPTPTRHRAKSQQASPEDVPRIAELTRRLRETEAERDALKASTIPREMTVAAPVTTDKPPTGVTKRDWAAEVARYKAMPDAPDIRDFQEYSDYGMAVDLFVNEKRAQEAAQRTQQETERTRVASAWRERVDSAKTRYPDFEQVALLAPTNIPQGSLIDAWILEHRSGADVLYSLQKDPAELRRILALPLFDQVDALSLLAQRLSPTREPAEKTGAAAATPRAPAPRPPTPVRTSAMPAADEPPDPETSTLAEHEKFYGRHVRR